MGIFCGKVANTHKVRKNAVCFCRLTRMKKRVVCVQRHRTERRWCPTRSHRCRKTVFCDSFWILFAFFVGFFFFFFSCLGCAERQLKEWMCQTTYGLGGLWASVQRKREQWTVVGWGGVGSGESPYARMEGGLVAREMSHPASEVSVPVVVVAIALASLAATVLAAALTLCAVA